MAIATIHSMVKKRNIPTGGCKIESLSTFRPSRTKASLVLVFANQGNIGSIIKICTNVSFYNWHRHLAIG